MYMKLASSKRCFPAAPPPHCSSASQLTDSDLEPLFKLTALQRLSLANLEQLSEPFLERLVQHFGLELRELSLEACRNVTDVVLVAIRSCCQHLRLLNLRELNVSTEGLLGLFITAPDQSTTTIAACGIGALEEVNLRATFGVTDDVVVQLVTAASGLMQRLNLHSCHALTNRSLMALRAHCHRSLRHLDLSYVRGISNQALGALVDGSPLLKELHVYGCSQVSRTDDVKMLVSLVQN